MSPLNGCSPASPIYEMLYYSTVHTYFAIPVCTNGLIVGTPVVIPKHRSESNK